MNRAEKISRLVIELSNALPEETDYLIILAALLKLQARILDLLHEERGENNNYERQE